MAGAKKLVNFFLPKLADNQKIVEKTKYLLMTGRFRPKKSKTNLKKGARWEQFVGCRAKISKVEDVGRR